MPSSSNQQDLTTQLIQAGDGNAKAPMGNDERWIQLSHQTGPRPLLLLLLLLLLQQLPLQLWLLF